MNKFLIKWCSLLFFLLFTSVGNAQDLRIEYYKWTKTHYKNGTIKTMDGKSGQFVTRHKKVCYDSDNEGCTVHNGSLTFKVKKGNSSMYYGPSYYGTKTYYTFFDDKGILNIEDDIGNVYVYVKSTPPSNRKTSSLIASERNSGGSGSSGSVYIPPVNTDVSSGSSSGSKKIRKTCAVCKGTGRVVKGSMASIGKSRKYCSECGREVDSSHYHGMCSGCNGRGYTEY